MLACGDELDGLLVFGGVLAGEKTRGALGGMVDEVGAYGTVFAPLEGEANDVGDILEQGILRSGSDGEAVLGK